MHDTTLIYPGGDVKALGAGRVGGYLVRFGGPDSADVQGDFFTSDTYYGKAVKAGADVIYHHGIGRIDTHADRLRNTVIGDGEIAVKADGLWIEATVTDADVYALADAGKLGWSSGSVERLVKREAVKAGITKVTQWPIIEASLSPRPVDPRNRAVAMKALQIDEAPGSGRLADRLDALVSSVGELTEAFGEIAGRHDLNAKKREAIKAAAEGFARLYDATAPRPDPATRDALKRRLLASRI
jgi:hypothetical protein